MVFKRLKAKPSKKSRSCMDSNELFARVQKRAHELYEKRGCSSGNDWADWFEAERQIKKGLALR